jgi:uncharacterized protein (DUF1778 family)
MTTTNRTQKIDIRLTPEHKQTLQAAAAASNQSVSEFVLESALEHAAETLPDRRHFVLNTEQWEAFMAALDAPPRDMPRLRKLLNEPSIFDAPSDQ